LTPIFLRRGFRKSSKVAHGASGLFQFDWRGCEAQLSQLAMTTADNALCVILTHTKRLDQLSLFGISMARRQPEKLQQK
jgi:hypothetical protein